MHQLPIPITITRAINIDCSVSKAVDFMSDAPQWLLWAMPHVEYVLPLPLGQWLVKTATGLAKLRTHYDAAHGAAHCELLSAAATQVPMQVLPTPFGCHLALTFTKPEQLNFEAFEASLHHATQELYLLKMVLEQD